MYKSALLAAALASAASTASALNWTWSIDNGLTYGTFTTDNDGLAGAAGTYTITGFDVTASNKFNASLVTSWDYTTDGPQGLVWDGTQATQFWREGLFTNESNFYGSPGQGDFSTVWVALSPVGVVIGDTDYNPMYQVLGAPQLAVDLTPVPVPGALPLLGSVLAAGAFAAARRRKG